MATYDPADAVTDADGRARVALRVTPGAAETAVPSGFDEWRGRFEARVAAPARDGAANEALVAAVEERFDAPVRVVRGRTSREKTVEVDRPPEAVLSVLAAAVE